jgi:quercetin dioxygenase-like cupin family protein
MWSRSRRREHPGQDITVACGEIYLVTETDETLLRPGDTAVVQGVNHAWAKSHEPCVIIGVNVRANPWPADS